jgi:predicted glycosyl hydrolase (DUF1957 family)
MVELNDWDNYGLIETSELIEKILAIAQSQRSSVAFIHAERRQQPGAYIPLPVSSWNAQNGTRVWHDGEINYLLKTQDRKNNPLLRLAGSYELTPVDNTIEFYEGIETALKNESSEIIVKLDSSEQKRDIILAKRY